jgi:hypothetical protein
VYQSTALFRLFVRGLIESMRAEFTAAVTINRPGQSPAPGMSTTTPGTSVFGCGKTSAVSINGSHSADLSIGGQRRNLEGQHVDPVGITSARLTTRGEFLLVVTQRVITPQSAGPSSQRCCCTD